MALGRIEACRFGVEDDFTHGVCACRISDVALAL
jgi:hypothetical protein